MDSPKDGVGKEGLPLSPPVIPPHVVAIKTEPSPRPEHLKLTPMARSGFGSDGRHIQLLSNHFSVRFTARDAVFYHYSVCLICIYFFSSTVGSSSANYGCTCILIFVGYYQI